MSLDVTIITGMSGAGRSEAAHVLEDLGFFVIDNLPPTLIAKVAELARSTEKPIRYALVVDVRSRRLPRTISPRRVAELRDDGAHTRVLFLDASDDVLVRRYEASRRRHPLSRHRPGQRRHRPRARAARGAEGRGRHHRRHVELNVHELRDRLRELFAEHVVDGALQVSVVSFGYKHGLPIDVDLVFDCRFLPNPHWVDELRPLTGLDADVREYVLSRPRTEAFLDELDSLFALLLPGYEREGKAYLSIGVGCTGGRHRSVVIAERARRTACAATGYRADASTTATSTATPDVRADASSRSAAGTAWRSRCARIREYAGEITAVVSVADDGGSSGRLRRDLDVPAPGDLRRAWSRSRADGGPWPAAFEHRFRAASSRATRSATSCSSVSPRRSATFRAALDEAGRLLGAVGPRAARHDRAGRR